MNERRLRSRKILDLVQENPSTIRSTGTKRRVQTRKPKTERKKQKINLVETVSAHAPSGSNLTNILSSTFFKELEESLPKSIPTRNNLLVDVPPSNAALTSSSLTFLSGSLADPANEISHNPTRMSYRSDSFDSLPDAFLPATPSSLSVITNLMSFDLEKPEEVDPQDDTSYLTRHLKPENTKKDPTPGSSTAAIIDEPPPEAVVRSTLYLTRDLEPENTKKNPNPGSSTAAISDEPPSEAVEPSSFYLTRHIEPENTTKDPTPGSSTAAIIDEPPSEAVDPSTFYLTIHLEPENTKKDPTPGSSTAAIIDEPPPEAVVTSTLYLTRHLEPENTKKDPTPGSSTAAIIDEPPPEAVEPSTFYLTRPLEPEHTKKNPTPGSSTAAIIDAPPPEAVEPSTFYLTRPLEPENTKKDPTPGSSTAAIIDEPPPEAVVPSTLDLTRHLEPENTKKNPTPGSITAAIIDEPPLEVVVPSTFYLTRPLEPENTKKEPTPGSSTAARIDENPSEAVKPALNLAYVEHRVESSTNQANASFQTDIEKDSLNITRKIYNDQSFEQLSPCFDSDSDYSGLSNDKNYVPSSYESLSESDHDLEIENECLDEPHEVPLSRCEDKNITEIENDSLSKFSSEDDIEKETEINKENVEVEDVLEDEKEKGKRIRERDFCFYCETFILNFARHMVRNHPAEPEVQEALSYAKNSQQRKKKFSDLRKKCNYVSNSQNSFKPVKKCRFSEKTDYLPCSKCLGFYAKKQLWRHVKICDNSAATNNAQAQAQNFLVRYVKVDKNLKETVFPRMRPDKISLVAKKDKLICMFGAQYLKTHREKHFATVVTRKMRELAKLLIEATKLKPNINNFEQLLKPQYYDTLVHSTKIVARFNEVTHQFGAPTYAMNIATSIKQCCSIALLQSCKLEATIHTAAFQADLKTLSKLIEENWKFDISSQAADDLNVKKWNKTTLVPLATDLKLFKDYLCGISRQSSDTLTKEKNKVDAFNNLVESTYCRVLLLNRRRPGELQRVKLNDYNEHGNDSNKYEEFDKVLSSTERILVDKLKRIVIRGKRGRPVPVLFTTEMQDDIKTILSVRDMYIGSDNNLLFVKAGGVTVCGYKIIEKYAKACGAKNYKALTSTRLRKHLATMTQLFAMTETELEQLATFMGHTLSVHKNNYRLPNDVYQTAKISKLLLLMEDGKADMYQGKALDEIDLDMDEEIKGAEIENHEVIDFELEEEGSSQNEDEGSSQMNKQSPLKDLTNKSSTKKKRTLVPWTAEQKNVVTKYFKDHIKNKKPPKRAECDELKNKYPTLLHNKDWLKIKVYIQNTYSKR